MDIVKSDITGLYPNRHLGTAKICCRQQVLPAEIGEFCRLIAEYVMLRTVAARPEFSLGVGYRCDPFIGEG